MKRYQEIKYLFQDFNNQMFKEIVWNIAQSPAPNTILLQRDPWLSFWIK